MFFPVPGALRKNLDKDLKFIGAKGIIIPQAKTYAKFIKVKKDVLSRDISKSPPSITLKAKKLRDQLKLKLNFLLSKIKEEFNFSQITVYIIPKLGENAESLGNILVLGDGFKSNIAIGVILEELVHSSLKNKQPKLFSRILPRRLSDELKEEAVVGYYLYKILTRYKILGEKDADSLVFGWQNGRRAKFVRQLMNLPDNDKL